MFLRQKERRARKLDIVVYRHNLADLTVTQFQTLLQDLASDPSIDGVWVERPLPEHLRHLDERIYDWIPYQKDPEGLHPRYRALLYSGVRPTILPPTAAAVMYALRRSGISLESRRALVIGRSLLVGRPIFHLLLIANATPTVAHSRSRDLPRLVAEAEVLVVAVGQPRLVHGEWIREGAYVVDVGTNVVNGQLVGDVDPAAGERAAWITPVPGGIGPLTSVLAVANVLRLRELLAFPIA